MIAQIGPQLFNIWLMSAQAKIGEQPVAALILTFDDQPVAPISPDIVAARLDSLAAKLNDESYGIFNLTGKTVYGPWPANVSTVCPPPVADVLAAHGVSLEPNTILEVVFPSADCNNRKAYSDGLVNYFNGGNNFIVNFLLHETGHSLWLPHSNGTSCLPVIAPCSVSEYGDILDPMGTGYNYEFNGIRKQFLGWLTVDTITESGVYSFPIYENGNPIGAAKRIVRSRDSQGLELAYLIQRQSVGYTIRVQNVYWLGTVLIKSGPAGKKWLLPGESYTDSITGMTLSVLGNEDLDVQLGVIDTEPFRLSIFAPSSAILNTSISVDIAPRYGFLPQTDGTNPTVITKPDGTTITKTSLSFKLTMNQVGIWQIQTEVRWHGMLKTAVATITVN